MHSVLIILIQDEDDPFFVVDVNDVMRKYEKWKLELPRVHPYYGNCFMGTNDHSLQVLSIKATTRGRF